MFLSTARTASVYTGEGLRLAQPVGNEVEIRSGLSGSEQIVVAGQQKVREGSLVEIAGGGK